MEPAGRRSSGFLQVREFSTGKGIKPHRQVSFLQVREKRQAPTAAVATPNFFRKLWRRFGDASSKRVRNTL
jgi:hypothetical protein